jgi:CRP-like cAMP-binding protein
MYLEIERILELNKDVLNLYSHLLQRKQYSPNTSVYKQDEVVKKGFLVKNGVFKLCGISKSGKESVIDFFFKDDLFIPLSFFTDGVSTITSVTACESNFSGMPELISISTENYNKILADKPEFSIFSQSISYNMISRIIDHHIFGKHENRTKKKKINEMRQNNHPIISSGLKHRDIASYFGITEIFYSKIFQTPPTKTT